MLFLQETHTTKDKDILSLDWKGKILCSHANSSTAGCAILLNSNLQSNILDVLCDDQGRFIISLIEIDAKKILFVNIYTPNLDSEEFFVNIFRHMDSDRFMDRKCIIMGGDFNLVMNPKIDRYQSDYNHIRSHAALTEYADRTGLADIWRIRNPGITRYTWHRAASLSASRINMFFISDSYATLVHNVKINYGIRSDHSNITLQLTFSEHNRGPGVWKFNNKLLLEQEYKEGIITIINDTKNKFAFANPEIKWNSIKRECISFTKKFAKAKSVQDKCILQALYVQKTALLQELMLDKNNDEEDRHTLECVINQTTYDIEKLENSKVESTIFRSRCKWVREGKKSSKFFFSLEKNNYLNKNLKCVVTTEGKVTYNQKEILQLQTEFLSGSIPKGPTGQI